jgi:8-oxo-dGTP pyrophosphatase MutT (NUDIX family)
MAVVRCVGGIVFDPAGRLLLIRRGHAPAAGRWSIPGGRVEPGESDELAVVRELAEETALPVVPGPLVGTVTRPGIGGDVYEIYDYDCTVGTLDGAARSPAAATAGDDAAELRWVGRAEFATLELTDGLWDALAGWGRLPIAP